MVFRAMVFLLDARCGCEHVPWHLPFQGWPGRYRRRPRPPVPLDQIRSPALQCGTSGRRGGDQARRHLGAIHFLQVRLDLAHRHTAGMQREDLVVESLPASLVLLDDLRIEGAMPVAGHLDGQLTKLALELVEAKTVTGIAGRVAHRLMLVVPE
jgi:hypothetical protein